jgi:hypothetical protein
MVAWTVTCDTTITAPSYTVFSLVLPFLFPNASRIPNACAALNAVRSFLSFSTAAAFKISEDSLGPSILSLRQTHLSCL